jgi:hypothetical protein
MTLTGLPLWAVAGLLAAAAGVLGVLQMLRVRPRPVRVVTTLFWDQASRQARARTLLERFRHPLTYALLLAIAALVILALGEPRLGASGQTDWTVIVLDAGAPMAAQTGDGGTRLSRGVQRALAEADALSGTGRVAVLLADPYPRPVLAMGRPPAGLGRRLESVSPAAVPADLDAAVRAATGLLAGRDGGRIVLITSADRPRTAGEVGGVTVEPVLVGSRTDRLAIVAVVFEPSDDPRRGGLRIRWSRSGSPSAPATLTVRRAGGAVLLERELTGEADPTGEALVGELPADGDRLIIELDGPTVLPADRRLELRLPRRPTIAVWADAQVPAEARLLIETAPEMNLSPEAAADVILQPAGERAAGPLAIDPNAPIVIVSPEAFAEVSSDVVRVRRTVELARAIRRLAGWEDEPLVLPGERWATEPLAGERLAPQAPPAGPRASRSSLADATSQPSQAPGVDPVPGGSLDLARWLLSAAVLLAAVEAILHLRGRIP